MSQNILRVGIAGAGIVGAGVIEILMTRAALLEQRSGVRLALTRVAESDTAKARAAGAPEEIIVADGMAVAASPDIDIFVELIGGTNTAEKMVRLALQAGKPVVTANKALLAEKGRPLFSLAREKGVPLAFEAAVCGGIPIILALREGLIANRTLSLLGIVNGTCNFILTRMAEKISYAAALAEAQRQGYAEADPRLDVEGIDSGHKLALLSALAFDTWPDFNFLPIEGVSRLDVMDVEFANYLEYTVKLLAVARTAPDGRRLFLSVHPALLPREHPLAGVHGSMNAVVLETDVAKEAMFYGRGAGRYPTASAVVSDIVAVAHARKSGERGWIWAPEEKPAYALGNMADYRSRYYLRFIVEDRPGVLGRITTALGDHEVSIASVHQFESELKDNQVPVTVLTHTAREGDVRAALQAIGPLAFMRAEPVMLRIEG